VDLQSFAIKIARSENLGSPPEIVNSVLKAISEEDTSGRVIERLIERDPAMTAKVLRAANSAYYGCNNVPTVGRAISVLGLTTVRSMILSVAYGQMMTSRGQAKSFDKNACWRHSLAVATAARIIGKMRMPMKSEELYAAGILHDVGMLVLDRFAPEQLDESIRLAFDANTNLHEAERRVLGFDHAAVGALLAEKWSLPPIITDAVQYHSEPLMSTDQLQTTCIVATSDQLADQFGFANNAPGGLQTSDPEVEATVDLPLEQLVIVGQVMVNEVTQAQRAFRMAA
jgi:putative nucleotidyltransferase with HDIG domain